MKILAHAHTARAHWLNTPIGSGAYRRWLIDRGSLTRQLQLHCANFRVRPVKHSRARPQIDEARLLATSVRSRILLREVQLYCDDAAVVFAQSVLPIRNLRGCWHGLVNLGSRSLGSELFADPRVVRMSLEFRKLAQHHALYRCATSQMAAPPPALWARRSVFRLRGAAILVTEVFLPRVLGL